MKALLLVPLLLLIGCPSGTNQQKAANAAKNVAVFLQQSQQAELTVFNNGQSCLQTAADKLSCIVITTQEHVFIEEQFKTLAEADKTLDSCIRVATNTAGIVTCVNSAVVTVDQLNSQGALYLKSDKAKSTYAAVMTAVKLGIQTVSTVLGGVS